MTTDTTERGFETLICTALTGRPCEPSQKHGVHERPSSYSVGWLCGDSSDYDREFCVDLAQLFHLPQHNPARCGRLAPPRPGRPDATRVPLSPPG